MDFPKDSNIHRTLQLLSICVKQDSVVSMQELTFVKMFLRSIYPEALAEYLFEQFQLLCEEEIDSKALFNELRESLDYTDKYTILVKLIELCLADGIDKTEESFLKIVCSYFSIDESSLTYLVAMLSNQLVERPELDNPNIKYLYLTSESGTGTLKLPVSCLDITLFSIGSRLFLLNNGVDSEVFINDGRITTGISYVLPRFFSLSVDGKFILDHKSSHGYFRSLSQGETIKDFDSTSSLKRYEVERFLEEGEVVVGNFYGSDLLIEDQFDFRWKSKLRLSKAKSFEFEKNDCPHDIVLNGKEIKDKGLLVHGENIFFIHEYRLTVNTKTYKTKLSRGFVESVVVKNISHVFNDNKKGLDRISFRIERQELVGILGVSGSGKTTLLNALSGRHKPHAGQVEYGGYDLYDNFSLLKKHISLVPQDDLLHEELTVFENLFYNAKLRYPYKDSFQLKLIIRNALEEVRLKERSNVRVGSPLSKTLSGGERKRLNIALELISSSSVYFFDEPTSGLSSSDSEKIFDVLKRLRDQGKIVFAVVHQPSDRFFKFFDKLIFLDKGGKLVCFGSREEVVRYFGNLDERLGTEDNVSGGLLGSLNESEFIINTIGQSVRDLNGSDLQIRKYSSEFLQQRFLERREDLVKENSSFVNERLFLEDNGRLKWMTAFKTLMGRSFKKKIRDRSNLLITFLIPPILGVFVAIILRYTQASQKIDDDRLEEYLFNHNDHIHIFLFLSTLVAIFLGLTGSVEEIIKEQKNILRERLLGIPVSAYYYSKFLNLSFFALIQNTLFVVVGYSILGGGELFGGIIAINTLAALSGIGLGLLISTMPKLSSKAAINLIPLVLIPQIIFGGALINYEQMNKKLTLFKSESPMPEFIHFIPSRWSYEGLLAYVENKNTYARLTKPILQELAKLDEKITMAKRTGNSSLNALKTERGNLEIKKMNLDSREKLFYSNQKIGFVLSENIIFKSSKEVPFMSGRIPTHLYNAFVLVIAIIVLNILGLFALKFRFQ